MAVPLYLDSTYYPPFTKRPDGGEDSWSSLHRASHQPLPAAGAPNPLAMLREMSRRRGLGMCVRGGIAGRGMDAAKSENVSRR